MALQPNDVDGRAYVWTTRPGQASPGTSEVLISAHGLASAVNSQFSRNWRATLVYYGPHGYFLKDPGLDAVMRNQLKIVEVQDTTDQCQDYLLTKFQGRHGGGPDDSYQAIAGKTNRFVEAHTKYQRADQYAQAGRQQMATMMRQQAALSFGTGTAMDIITIRNRWRMGNIMLSTLLELVHNAGYNYTTFHCVFCRGGLSAGISDTVYDKTGGMIGTNWSVGAQPRG